MSQEPADVIRAEGATAGRSHQAHRIGKMPGAVVVGKDCLLRDSANNLTSLTDVLILLLLNTHGDPRRQSEPALESATLPRPRSAEYGKCNMMLRSNPRRMACMKRNRWRIGLLRARLSRAKTNMKRKSKATASTDGAETWSDGAEYIPVGRQIGLYAAY